jgi:hypothetical protein
MDKEEIVLFVTSLLALTFMICEILSKGNPTFLYIVGVILLLFFAELIYFSVR